MDNVARYIIITSNENNKEYIEKAIEIYKQEQSKVLETSYYRKKHENIYKQELRIKLFCVKAFFGLCETASIYITGSLYIRIETVTGGSIPTSHRWNAL